MTDAFIDAPRDAAVLVAVVNQPEDLLRAQREGWYRIPLARAPSRLGADFLALYLTGAFPAEERWAVRWVAPVRGYHLTTRRQLIPEQPEHPRADERYYRVDLGALSPLSLPIPSRRLRRITFIRTTVERLLEAREINDLWLKPAAHERLWEAIKQAGQADIVEREYPLLDDLPHKADFAVLGEEERIAVIVDGSAGDLEDCIQERAGLDYPLARGGWRGLFVDPAVPDWVERCLASIREARSKPADSQRKSL